MARIRSVKPDFWTDEKIVELDMAARLFFIGTWNFADDNGNLQRSARKLKMQIFPADSIDCEPVIQSLIAHGLLREYSVNGDDFLHITGFRKHQVINRKSKSAIPLPEFLTESDPENDEDSLNDDGSNGRDSVSEDASEDSDSVSTHGAFTEDSLTEGKGRERKGKNIARSSSRKTELPVGFAVSDQVREWAAKNHHGRLDAHLQHFVGYAKANGAKYADWDQAFMNAIRSNWAKLPAVNGHSGGDLHRGVK